MVPLTLFVVNSKRYDFKKGVSQKCSYTKTQPPIRLSWPLARLWIVPLLLARATARISTTYDNRPYWFCYTLPRYISQRSAMRLKSWGPFMLDNLEPTGPNGYNVEPVRYYSESAAAHRAGETLSSNLCSSSCRRDEDGCVILRRDWQYMSSSRVAHRLPVVFEEPFCSVGLRAVLREATTYIRRSVEGPFLHATNDHNNNGIDSDLNHRKDRNYHLPRQFRSLENISRTNLGFYEITCFILWGFISFLPRAVNWWL